ncbi:MAG: VCBS repeat-containing protein [Mameliella sp.]|nr:VCBS repeat-containing protein [Phaeodactylibacter sp.]
MEFIKMKLRIIFLLLLTASAVQAQPIFGDGSTDAGIGDPGRNFGIAFGDYNGDLADDIYVSRHNAPNLLYKAIGNGKFEEVASEAGVGHVGTTTVSTWGDMDNDGDLDLYLGNRDELNVLYRNNGDGTFENISESAGVNAGHRTRAVLWGDVDQDGYIDLYVANLAAPNYLYHNNGDGTFTDITAEANAQDFGIAMGSLFFDYDNDGDLDLYLTHDANQPNILYRNDGTGHFDDVSAQSGANIAAQGMGVDFADINNDGFFDLYITNLYENVLLVNNGNGTFTEFGGAAGVDDLGMGWGAVFLDYDNDGYSDIYISNDTYFAPYDNLLYRNLGNETFEVVGADTPLSSPMAGYGVATGDVNSDGRPDLLLVNAGTNDGNQLLVNATNNGHHFVKVRLKGMQCNAAAIGARVTIEAGGQVQMDEVCAGMGYASQNSFTLHFGLGAASIIDRIEIRWPNGVVETYEALEVDQHYYFTEGQGQLTDLELPQKPLPTLTVLPNPVSDLLYLQIEGQGATEAGILQIFGSSGALIHQSEFDSGGASHLSVANWTTGVYWVKWSGISGQSVQQIVKQ